MSQYGGREEYIGASGEGAGTPRVTQTRVTTPHENGSEVEEVRVDIEATRAEMSGTIDAIQEKLDPTRLKQQAKETVRDATVGRAEHMMSSAGETAKEKGSGLLETIKDNPVPAALAAVGLGWLFMSGRGQSSSSQRNRYAYEYDVTYPTYAGRAQVQPTSGHESGGVQQRASQAAHQAQDEARHLGSEAQHQAQRARSQFQQMMEENPMAVGAVAIGLGAALGLAIPESQQEHELMGERRDELMDRAKAVAEDTARTVKDEGQKSAQHVAEKSKETAQQSAQQHAP